MVDVRRAGRIGNRGSKNTKVERKCFRFSNIIRFEINVKTRHSLISACHLDFSAL